MSINTKLVLLLTLTVGAVMFVASFLSLSQREAALEGALRDELRAHAVTLQIALEEKYALGRSAEAQQLIDKLRQNSKIFAVLLFDDNQNLIALSQPLTFETFRNPPELPEVLETGESKEFVREVEGQKFASVILPMQVSRERRGAVEIVKPLSLVQDDIYRSRLNWAAVTLFLLAVIFLCVFLVLRRSLSQPITALLEGAEALEHGNLAHRVVVPQTGDELARLAVEFNRMADSLEQQRRAIERENASRLALERELRHSERLASVGRLAAGIAHELGAPLNVIDARAEQLLTCADASLEKRERNLQIIRSNAGRITHLVRQLLNLSRPYNLYPAPIDLNELIESTLEQIEENSEKARVNISFRAEQQFTISADREYLRQVFLNVLMNALQAMPNGGQLTVKTTKELQNGEQTVAVEISDNGAGIASEHIEKIFDPFYTTKDIGQGTGLGLAVAQRIVEEHGGTIAASNNFEGGATFKIYLPVEE